MNLQKIIEMGKIHSLIYLENFVNQGSPSGFSSQGKVLGEFAAGRILPIEIFLIKPNSPILEYSIQNIVINSSLQHGILAIHPLVMNQLDKDKNITEYEVLDKINAYVTASGRTVLAQIQDKYTFIKLHFPRVLGRVNRHLPLRKAIAGVEISNIIVECMKKKHLKDVGILPEIKCCGTIQGGLDDSISFIERSATIINNTCSDTSSFLIPGFSLFSPDIKCPGDKLLIQQICEQFHIYKPRDFYERIIHPLLVGYLKLTFEYGLMPEINAQNILYAIDLNKQLIYPVLRDMGRVEKLLYINSHLETLLSYPYKTIHENQRDYALKRHSFSFDFKLTQYVLQPLVESFCKTTQNLNINSSIEIYKYASETLNTFDIARLWLPKDRKVIGHPKILLTGERPYIEMGNPLII